jgi:hypothetical protein
MVMITQRFYSHATHVDHRTPFPGHRHFPWTPGPFHLPAQPPTAAPAAAGRPPRRATPQDPRRTGGSRTRQRRCQQPRRLLPHQPLGCRRPPPAPDRHAVALPENPPTPQTRTGRLVLRPQDQAVHPRQQSSLFEYFLGRLLFPPVRAVVSASGHRPPPQPSSAQAPQALLCEQTEAGAAIARTGPAFSPRRRDGVRVVRFLVHVGPIGPLDPRPALACDRRDQVQPHGVVPGGPGLQGTLAEGVGLAQR